MKVRQALEVYTTEIMTEQLEILTGLDYSKIKQSEGEKALIELAKLDMLLSSEIEVKTKQQLNGIKTPQIESESWGQKILAEQLIDSFIAKEEKTKSDMVNLAVDLCSLYFQKQFDETKIEETKTQLLENDVFEVINCGFFLFSQYLLFAYEKLTKLDTPPIQKENTQEVTS